MVIKRRARFGKKILKGYSLVFLPLIYPLFHLIILQGEILLINGYFDNDNNVFQKVEYLGCSFSKPF